MVDLKNPHDKEVWRDGFLCALKLFAPSVSTDPIRDDHCPIKRRVYDPSTYYPDGDEVHEFYIVRQFQE